MTDFIQVQVTFPDKETAESTTSCLLERKMIACGQINGQIRSIYRWKGKIEDQPEYIALFKTRLSLFKELSGIINEMHPYDVPEIIALPILAGIPQYIDWMDTVIVNQSD